MAKQVTFTVSKKGHPGIKVTCDRSPETIEEFESLGLVKNYPQGVVDLAFQNWIIKVQSGARQRLEQGEAAVQKYVDEYVFGDRAGGGGFRKPVLAAAKAKELKFTKAQLEALAAAGLVLEEEQAEEPAAATA